MPAPRADFEGLLRAFSERGVRFVVIGGVSAAMQSVPAVTYHLDLVLDHDSANLDTAFEVLRELEAAYREHLPKRLEPNRSDLESDGSMLLMTRLGPLDIRGRVATGWRNPELLERARTVRLDGDHELSILDLSALIEIKERVGREKDLAVLPLYRKALSERRSGGSRSPSSESNDALDAGRRRLVPGGPSPPLHPDSGTGRRGLVRRTLPPHRPLIPVVPSLEPPPSS